MDIRSTEKILLLGATGLLGSSLRFVLAEQGHRVFTHGRSEGADYLADISNQAATFQLLDEIRPDVIVNLVGLTNVDRCEAEPAEAYLVNVKPVENICDWINQSSANCHLVQISTDQVYDGNGRNDEQDVKLTNTYASTKYQAELAASSVSSTILRTNFFGLSHCSKRTSLTDWLFESLSNGKKIQIFEDVYFSPLSMPTLSKLIERVCCFKPCETMNLGSREGMNKADFAFLFAKMLGLPTQEMHRASTDQVDFLQTYRPKDMRLNVEKFEKIMGIRLPTLASEIELTAREYQ